MSGDRKENIITTLLGGIIGALLVVLVFQVFPSTEKKQSHSYSPQWSKLNLVLKALDENYVDSVDASSLSESAIKAILEDLDPHSIYLSKEALSASETDLAGNFDGIGIQFNVPNDTAMVLEVIAGGPAEKVGMRQGDRLIKVDSVVIAGVKFPQDSMVAHIKGPSGSKVQVLVLRDGEEILFDITRGKIPVHSVDTYFMVDDSTGYIRLSKFAMTTYEEVLTASIKLIADGMTQLIFDLRDNTGGYFNQALLISNLFLDKGDGIVYLEGLHRKREVYKADGKGILKNIGLQVLINESSASSSEIVAGAIQDNDRGVVIGRRSYGKGLVQEPVYFTDGTGMRITISRFHTPSGRCIQKPYTDDYGYDIYKRYYTGEMFDKDSMKVDTDSDYLTKLGRTVYGGGGIIPDVFVPVDTTSTTQFYRDCSRRATQMRFASAIYDQYKGTLSAIEDYDELESFLSGLDIPARFLSYAYSKDGIRARAGEWSKSSSYMLPQIRALIGRYSLLGDNAFYKLYLPVDDVVAAALESPFDPLEL